MHTKRLVGLVLAIGLAISACSSGGKTPAKADYIKQANAICAKGNKASDAIGKSIDTTNQAAVIKAVKDKLVPLIRSQIKDIEALGYPKGDKATLKAIFDKEEAILDGFEKDPKSALNGSTAAGDAVDKSLKAYGLTECGQD